MYYLFIPFTTPRILSFGDFELVTFFEILYDLPYYDCASVSMNNTFCMVSVWFFLLPVEEVRQFV